MRSLALVFLCFCLAMSGTAAASPMVGVAMAATVETTAGPMSMMPDCPDMADVALPPAADSGVGSSDEKKPACCDEGGCICVAAHGVFQAFSTQRLPHSTSQPTTLVEFGDRGYASPALARLVRPPIS